MRTASFSAPLSGRGVHTGQSSSIRFARHPGPVAFVVAGASIPLASFVVDDTTRATTLRAGAVLIRTVEHLFAALAGLSLYAGVAIALEGDEVPLLDGGAARFADALVRLEAPPSSPRLEVVREGVVDVGESRFEFSPSEARTVAVTIDFGNAPIAPAAAWDGEAADFQARIAPARTFVLEHEIASLGEAELARFADAESVVVVGRELYGARGVAPDEPARHKLLDFLGDAYVHGGPPRGALRAHRPGHRANHAALRAAIDRGILRRIG